MCGKIYEEKDCYCYFIRQAKPTVQYLIFELEVLPFLFFILAIGDKIMGKESFGKKILNFFGMSQPEPEVNTPGMEVVAPVSGTIVALKDVEDEAFSSGALGNGCAISPTVGEVYAPCDGIISVIPDTNHAIGITANNGAEVLVHVGMNTVELKGKGFEVLVKEEQSVKKGELLMTFDMAVIQAEGYPLVTPVVVNNSDEYSKFEVLLAPGAVVKKGDLIIQGNK